MQDIPIVDPHRHFGGSISAKFVWSLVQEHDMHWLGETFGDIEREMRMMPGEPYEFYRFLQKFKILNRITWSEELIDLSVKQVCDDLKAEGVDFCWLHFTITKYLGDLKWHRKDVIKFLCDRFLHHGEGRVGPILCLKYEDERASQRQIAKLIEHPEVYENVHGIDLVGDEGHYDASFYGPLLKPWKDTNKALFAHVGESRSGKNIGTAIEYIGVTEICHGIKLFAHPGLISLARDHDVCFHQALTSNEQTGVTTTDHHPIVSFIHHNLPVTIGTDDPTQCNTTMSQEYTKLESYLRNSMIDGQVAHAVQEVKQAAVDRAMKYGWRN